MPVRARSWWPRPGRPDAEFHASPLVRRRAHQAYVLAMAGAAALLAVAVLTAARDLPEVLGWILGGAAVWGVWSLIVAFLLGGADGYRAAPGGVRLAAYVWGALGLSFSGLAATEISHLVPASADAWRASLTAPVPEEAVKLIGVVLIALVVPAVAVRPMGALLCGFFCGLGFTARENWFMSNAAVIAAADEGRSQAGAVVEVLVDRGLLVSPWAHIAWTGLSALGVWYYVSRPRRSRARRLAVAAGLFAVAVTLHAAANAPPALPEAWRGPVRTTGAAIGLVLLFGLIWWARRAERSAAAARGGG